MNVFILQSLKQSLGFNRSLPICFFNTIEKEDNLKTLDIWVLFSLYEYPLVRSRIETFISKLKFWTLTDDIIIISIDGRKSFLIEFFHKPFLGF
jgi:hypothetical protein